MAEVSFLRRVSGLSLRDEKFGHPGQTQCCRCSSQYERSSDEVVWASVFTRPSERLPDEGDPGDEQGHTGETVRSGPGGRLGIPPKELSEVTGGEGNPDFPDALRPGSK